MDKRKIVHTIFKILKITLLVLIGLIVGILLFIRSPWGQDIVVGKALNYAQSKANTEINIDRLFITFSGNLQVEGLYVEDMEGDTLVYSKSLETGVKVWPLIKDGAIHLSKLDWDGLVANVSRKEDTGKFNFDFLTEAFTSADSTSQTPVDTTNQSSAMPDFSIGPINITNLKVKYLDEVMGIDTDVRLGKLLVEPKNIDLNSMGFYIKNIEFENTQAHYIQTKPFPPSEGDTTASVMPLVKLDHFSIKNVSALYHSQPDSLKAELSIGDFLLELPEADLAKNKIVVKNLLLSQSDIRLSMPAVSQETATSGQEEEVAEAAYEWPAYDIDIQKVRLDENRFDFTSGKAEVTAGVFDANAVSLDSIKFHLDQVYLNSKGAGLNLVTLGFEESSGLTLQDFTFNGQLTETEAKLNDLILQTDQNSLEGSAALTYNSLQALIDEPDKAKFKIDIPTLSLHLEEFMSLMPDLAEDPYVQTAMTKPLTGQLHAEGSLADLRLGNNEIYWGKNTYVHVQGALKNVSQPDQMSMDISTFTFHSLREDLLGFVDEKAMGIRIPDTLNLEGNVQGKLDDLNAQALLTSSQGTIDVKAAYQNTAEMAFDINLEASQLALGEILPGMGLGDLSVSLQSKGQGESLESLDATLSSDFGELSYNGYDLSGLELSGELTSGKGNVLLSFVDENLDMDLKADLVLDSTANHYTAFLDLRGANLQALGITQKDIRARLELKADFEGDPEEFELSTSITEGMVVYDGRSYPLGEFDLKAFATNDSTSMDVNSLMLNGYMRSNTSPQHLAEGLTRHIESYMRDSASFHAEKDSSHLHPVSLDLNLAFRRAPVLDQVFVEGLDQLDSIDINLTFDEAKQNLQANIRLPHLKYNDMALDSLMIEANGDGENMELALGFSGLEASPLLMGPTSINGNFKHRNLELNFVSSYKNDTTYYIDALVQAKGDSTIVSVLPAGLKVNKKPWETPESNQLIYADNSIKFVDFKFSNANQEVAFKNDLSPNAESQAGITFTNFNLAALLSLLNPQEAIVDGRLNGDFVVENPFTAPGLVADLQIKDLKVMDAELGIMSLKAKSVDAGSYDFDLSLKEKALDLEIKGDYIANETGAELDLNMDLKELQLKLLESLMPEKFAEASGSLQGNLSVSGTTLEPQYEGDFNFKEGSLLVKMLNSKFTLPSESLKVDQNGVYLSDYTFKDAQGNLFSLDGTIGTEDFTNMTFDLMLKADKFQVLNSGPEDNDLFYGKANINADVSIKGDMNLPKVDAKLVVNENTDLTFVIPETQLEVVEREGVVLIVDRDDPNDILTKRATESNESAFTGMDIKAILRVDPKAVFTVVIDERSGDNLMVAGEADLNLNIEPNGQMNLSGIYELSEGHYEMSLYSLVSRKFNIVKGSTITWKGNPMDADLAITASYDVKTSASDLMATQISGVSTEVASQYNQRLPFIVLLNVEGDLIKPQIFFKLDMPEDEQGALGGNVYTRLQQINEEEGELNRQVFSLLVLQKFMPSTGGDGSGSATSSIARSSVSQMLSSQMNALSNNVLGNSGFELNFDLDSYSDYTGDKTELNVSAQKRLFDDRLVVQVGSQMELESSSQESQNTGGVFGNVNIEYLLTENGRYRVRGFRKNEFESIIDGQVIVTGVAFILNREFNKFRNFWKSEEKIQKENQQGKEVKEEQQK